MHYKGGGETIKDLLSGQVKVMFSTIPPVLGFVRDGRLRGLATTPPTRDRRCLIFRPSRNPVCPDYDVRLWFGLSVPKGTPRPVIERLAAAVKQALASEDTLRRLAAAGYSPLPGTPEQFGEFYKSEVAKWAKVVETVGSLGD